MSKTLPREVQEALLTLTDFVALKASDPEQGYFFVCEGVGRWGVDLGDWRVEVTRIRKP